MSKEYAKALLRGKIEPYIGKYIPMLGTVDENLSIFKIKIALEACTGVNSANILEVERTKVEENEIIFLVSEKDAIRIAKELGNKFRTLTIEQVHDRKKFLDLMRNTLEQEGNSRMKKVLNDVNKIVDAIYNSKLEDLKELLEPSKRARGLTGFFFF